MDDDLYGGIEEGAAAEGLYEGLFTEASGSGHHEAYLQHKVNELEELLRERKTEVQALSAKLSARDQELARVTSERDTLLRNISCLFNTAKEEMARKQAEINALRSELAQQQQQQQLHSSQRGLQQQTAALPAGCTPLARLGSHMAPHQWPRDGGCQPARARQPLQEIPRPPAEGPDELAEAAVRKRCRERSADSGAQRQVDRPAEDGGSKRQRHGGEAVERPRGPAAGVDGSTHTGNMADGARRSDGGQWKPSGDVSNGGGKSEVASWRKDAAADREVGSTWLDSSGGGEQQHRERRGLEQRLYIDREDVRQPERGSDRYRGGRDLGRENGREAECVREVQREDKESERRDGREAERSREGYRADRDPRDSRRQRGDYVEARDYRGRYGDPDRR